MLRQIFSVGGLTLLSRVLGLFREMATASQLGAGPVADAFIVAFRLPNHFRALFAEGAFATAFVPVMAGERADHGPEGAKAFANQVLAFLLLVSFGALIAIELVMPAFIRLFAPGFSSDPPKFALAVLFTRITFPYLVLISLVSLQGGVLNAHGRFAAAAGAPILLNLAMIGANLAAGWFPTAGHALAWGTVLAGVAQFLHLAWACERAGLSLRLAWPRPGPATRRFARMLGQATLGAGMTQLALFADTWVGSLLPTGSISYLNYADRLNQLPLGVIGIAIGTVLLPSLTHALKAGETAEANALQNRAIELALMLTLPAALALGLAAYPMMALYRWGAFDARAAAGTAATLAAYAPGLPAFVLLRALLPSFYARHDALTPVKVAGLAIAVNIALKVLLMGPLAQVGIAMSTVAAAWINVLLLAFIILRRGKATIDDGLIRAWPRIMAANSIFALALAEGLRRLWPWIASDHETERLEALAILVLGGVLVYAAAGLATGMIRVGDARRMARRRPGPAIPD